MANTTKRVKRTPVGGARDILTVVNKDPNYVYRWVMNLPGRIERFKDGGYEVVTDDVEVGQNTVDRETKVGSAVTKHAGGGTNILILMRIPKEWYDEDQIAKQDKVDDLEATMQEDIRQGIIPGSREPGYGGSLVQSVSKGRR